MAKEIERKFLVRDTTILDGVPGQHMVQGYLSTTPVTTRVRIAGEQAYLTIKGPPVGISCDEFEYSIPLQDAREMLLLCGSLVVEKVRYCIPAGDYTLEVDVFQGRHEGLVLMEVELPAADALVAIPEWAGEEVSGQYEYTNAYLAKSS